jgi:hypothetical protein
MSNWKWWVVVVGSRDWHMYYDGTFVVKARSIKEAREKTWKRYDLRYWHEVCAIIGPLNEKPEVNEE